MTTHHRKLLPLCIAAALFSARVSAVGLGEIKLASYLGKPLQAEVALNDTGDLSADQLKVKIGSEADYQALGVEYSYLHTQFKVEPFLRDGRGYVRISTREPISEPYLNFVLNVHWPQGQVVREFTVLLDPAPTAVAAAGVPPQRAVPAELTEAPVAAPAPRRQHARRADTPTDGAYIVQRGDSLWRIASKLQSNGTSLEQAMNAILARNPRAFINGDPSRIKEAARIAMPSAEEIAAATGSSVAPAPEPGVVATKSVPAPAQPAPELIEENTALKAQVAELSGSVASLNQSLGQSEQRLHQLEAQLDNLLQQFQQQRATVAALSGNADVRAASAPLANTTGSMINQVSASELRPTAAARTPWWVHLLYWLGIGGVATWAIREHFWPQRRFATLMSAAAGGGVAVERTAAAVPGNRGWPAPAEINRDWQHADTIDEVVSSAELEEVIALPLAEVPPPELVTRPTDDPVDASISAGVFVAFGRYDEAERLLRDALGHAPERIDLKLQLLDVFMQADQREAFDALAREIEQGPTTSEIIAELAVLRESYRPRGH